MFKSSKTIQARFLPLLAIFCFLPLLVMTYTAEIDPISQVIYSNQTLIDRYFRYKTLLFIALNLWMLFSLLFVHSKITLKKDLYFRTYFILSFIFCLMTFLSAHFSEYPSIVSVGIATRFEGLIILILYICTMLYAFVVFEKASSFKYVIRCFSFIVIAQCFFGFFQFIGHDLLLIPQYFTVFSQLYTSPIEVLSATFDALMETCNWGDWHGTIGNKNYSGSFISMALPFFVCLTFFVKKRKDFRVLFVTILCSIFILFACKSQAGQVGTLCALTAFLILICRALPNLWHSVQQASRTKRLHYIGYTSFLIVYIASVMTFTGASQEIMHMFKSLSGNPVSSVPLASDMRAFDSSPHIIHLTTTTDTFDVLVNEDTLSFQDSQGNAIDFTQEGDYYTLVSDDFYSYSFALTEADDTSFVGLFTGEPDTLKAVCIFASDASHTFHPCHPRSLEPLNISTPDTFGFEGYEKLGSSRGYIWSRTLPLLSDHMILGCGPDVYLFAFPQDDFFGKWAFLNTPLITVDKPHNTFLQFWINQGFIACLAFILINTIYLIDSLRLYGFRGNYTLREGLGMAFMLAVIGYLGSSMFNDTCISVTPIYFALLGCGMAYNRTYRSHKQHTL